jgi:hypothetical protein
MTLTMQSLLDAMKLIDNPRPRAPLGAPLGSVRIVYSPHALKDTTERLFPASRHRSRRIRKKLIKRFGAEFRQTPGMWRVGDAIYAHPSFKAQIEAATVKL